MSNLYLLLYLPLAGLSVLWLVRVLKLAREHRKHSRGSLLRITGAAVSVALFLAGYAVMVVTHARGFRVAMMFVMVMALVNALRMMTLKTED